MNWCKRLQCVIASHVSKFEPRIHYEQQHPVQDQRALLRLGGIHINTYVISRGRSEVVDERTLLRVACLPFVLTPLRQLDLAAQGPSCQGAGPDEFVR